MIDVNRCNAHFEQRDLLSTLHRFDSEMKKFSNTQKAVLLLNSLLTFEVRRNIYYTSYACIIFRHQKGIK